MVVAACGEATIVRDEPFEVGAELHRCGEVKCVEGSKLCGADGPGRDVGSLRWHHEGDCGEPNVDLCRRNSEPQSYPVGLDRQEGRGPSSRSAQRPSKRPGMFLVDKDLQERGGVEIEHGLSRSTFVAKSIEHRPGCLRRTDAFRKPGECGGRRSDPARGNKSAGPTDRGRRYEHSDQGAAIGDAHALAIAHPTHHR